MVGNAGASAGSQSGGTARTGVSLGQIRSTEGVLVFPRVGELAVSIFAEEQFCPICMSSVTHDEHEHTAVCDNVDAIGKSTSEKSVQRNYETCFLVAVLARFFAVVDMSSTKDSGFFVGFWVPREPKSVAFSRVF